MHLKKYSAKNPIFYLIQTWKRNCWCNIYTYISKVPVLYTHKYKASVLYLYKCTDKALVFGCPLNAAFLYGKSCTHSRVFGNVHTCFTNTAKRPVKPDFSSYSAHRNKILFTWSPEHIQTHLHIENKRKKWKQPTRSV